MVAEQLDFLSGRAVQEIRIWGPFRLVFDDEATPPMYLDVEGPAVLAHGERTSDINFFTDGHPAESAALLELLWKRVVVSSIATGVLSLSFDSGAVLRALPSDIGESWRLSGGGRHLICLPGGEVIG